MTIVVHNKKTAPIVAAEGIYVGRPHPLGNPFRIGEDGTREEVIEKYREWLENKISQDPGGIEACHVRALKVQYLNTGRLDLICWCAPEACHADIIKEKILDGQQRVEAVA